MNRVILKERKKWRRRMRKYHGSTFAMSLDFARKAAERSAAAMGRLDEQLRRARDWIDPRRDGLEVHFADPKSIQKVNIA